MGTFLLAGSILPERRENLAVPCREFDDGFVANHSSVDAQSVDAFSR